jgi:general secretion pathway protein C
MLERMRYSLILLCALACAGRAAADSSVPGRGADRDLRCTGTRMGWRCEMSRRTFDAALEHTEALATRVHIVPFLRDGQPVGFKLFAIRPGSLLDRLWLRNGDVLLAIDDLQLVSPEKALALYARLRTADRFTVSLERDGEPRLATLEIYDRRRALRPR